MRWPIHCGDADQSRSPRSSVKWPARESAAQRDHALESGTFRRVPVFDGFDNTIPYQLSSRVVIQSQHTNGMRKSPSMSLAGCAMQK
jgi:hypothetical protein